MIASKSKSGAESGAELLLSTLENSLVYLSECDNLVAEAIN